MPSYNDLGSFLDGGKHKEGLSKCQKYLKKSPNDPILLQYQARFNCGLGQYDSARAAITMLSTRKPPITDLTAVHALYECACQLQELQYPPPLTAGPDANNLWSNAAKQCGNPIAANELRLRQAMSHQRWQDANSVRLMRA